MFQQVAGGVGTTPDRQLPIEKDEQSAITFRIMTLGIMPLSLTTISLMLYTQ
jgi:hypothetical protein